MWMYPARYAIRRTATQPSLWSVKLCCLWAFLTGVYLVPQREAITQGPLQRWLRVQAQFWEAFSPVAGGMVCPHPLLLEPPASSRSRTCLYSPVETCHCGFILKRWGTTTCSRPAYFPQKWITCRSSPCLVLPPGVDHSSVLQCLFNRCNGVWPRGSGRCRGGLDDKTAILQQGNMAYRKLREGLWSYIRQIYTWSIII